MVAQEIKKPARFCLKDAHSIISQYFPICQTQTSEYSLRTRHPDVPHVLLCLVFVYFSTERNKNQPFYPNNNLIYASQTK